MVPDVEANAVTADGNLDTLAAPRRTNTITRSNNRRVFAANCSHFVPGIYIILRAAEHPGGFRFAAKRIVLSQTQTNSRN